MKAPYDTFADRWGNQGFSDYVAKLEDQANLALHGAGKVTICLLVLIIISINNLR